MKRRLISLLFSTLLLFSLPSCRTPEPSVSTTALTIAATTYPVYLFTCAVTKDLTDVTVELIVQQQTSCLHDYTLTIRDIKIIEGADVLILNGAGLEIFMEDALTVSQATVIDSSVGIDLLPYEDHSEHDHGTEELDAEYDPHIWMDPERAAQMVETIADGLAQADPDHAQAYLENGSDFSAKLCQLKSTLQTSIFSAEADLSLVHRELITFHDGFQYFADAFDLVLLKSIEEEEGSEASAKEISEIISLIDSYKLPAIFTEVNGSVATAQAIARETGVQVFPLTMIMSGESSNPDTYCNAITENIKTIVTALSEEQVNIS